MRQQPLLRVVKRDRAGLPVQAAAYLTAILAAVLTGAVLLLIQGVDPLDFYGQMFTLAIPGSRYPWRMVENYIKLFVPLLIVSLALALAFKMRFWNIGGEGQFIIGALCASAAAMKLGEQLPQPVMLLVMSLCGLCGGGLYGVFAAGLKVKWGTNETLLTLMLNYLALYLLQFFAETKAPWNLFLDTASARPKFARFPDSAQMLLVPIGPFRLNLSLVAAGLLCAALFVYLKYAKGGYEIAVVGDSPSTARYAGMRVGRIVLRTIFLSAALIGLAGAFYVSTAGILSASVTNDVGWTGVVVAWLAKLNTLGIVATSALITVLQYGCQTASTSYPAIDANFANLLQGVILFLVLAADFFVRFRIVVRGRNGKEDSK